MPPQYFFMITWYVYTSIELFSVSMNGVDLVFMRTQNVIAHIFL